MRMGVALSVLVLTACGPSSVEPAPQVPEATVDVAEPTPSAATAEPEPAEPAEPAAASAWYAPLEPLTLRQLNGAQKKQVGECPDNHRVKEPDVRPEELAAAAECLGAIPIVGHEIRMYRLLLQRHPNAPEAIAATRALGRRYEQIDARDQAVKFYTEYLRRYPKQADARELGQRAVCLTHSLGIETKVTELLDLLVRFYGRRGFERPASEQLGQLCAAVPPLGKGPRVER